MSHSFHVTKRQRQKDRLLNRGDDGKLPSDLSKLDELSLKKVAAKETETWKRDAEKVGGLRHVEFVFKDDKVGLRRQKRHGLISDIPHVVVERKRKDA